MKKVGKFEKVSYEQFYHDIKEEFDQKFTDEEIKEIYENIKLPQRGTAKSAGYDFYAPFKFELKPNKVIKFPTGIRVLIDDGWFLACYPRSGLGFKYYETLANTVGIIDADYSGSKNEGHIWVKLINRNPFNFDKKEWVYNGTPDMYVKQGEGYMQGIFTQFGITVDDAAVGDRDGGFGSTDKKTKKKNDDYIEPLPGQINFEV